MGATKNNSTKGGSFIISETKSADVFTPKDFSEEQTMMKSAVQEFVDREIWPHKARFENKDYAFTKELMQKAGSLGFLGVSVPEAYGGLGMDFISTMLVCDYISGATGSFSTAFGAHTGIGTLPITLYGTEEQKQKYVPKLATGEWFGSYCLTEPSAGSDANSGKTKAVLSKDGSHYLITGQKMWISNAGFADLLIVFARIEDDKYITGFIIPNDPSNGITIGEEEHKLGIHSSSTRQIFFNKTKVPIENVLAERGKGFKIAMNALNVGRIKLSAASLDAQRRVITAAVNYANERIQFKTPIAQFGAIKEKLARMATNCYVGESACYRTAGNIQQSIEVAEKKGLLHQDAKLNAVEDFAIECCLLKVAISEDVQNCTDEGVQIFGGMGFSADTPMESAWRDARIGRIYEGTNEINRIHSVGMLLKKAMKGKLDLMTAVMETAAEQTDLKQKKPSKDLFATEYGQVKSLKKIFLLLTGNTVQKFGGELEKHQQLLLSLADILIEIYLAESAILRTHKDIDRTSATEQKYQIAMTQYYLYEAVEIVMKKGKEIIVSTFNDTEQAQLLKALNHYCSYAVWPNIIELKTTIADKIISENKYCF